MDTDLRPGDAVRFRSGGPAMVLNRVDRGRGECVWFEGRDFFHDWYDLGLLEPAARLTPHPPDADGRTGFAFHPDCLEAIRRQVDEPSSN